MAKSPDIVIFGAGIAGLWALHHLKRLGYDVLLLEKNSIGSGQSIAAQGIIHSGLKFSLAGKVNTLAHHISKMPEIWRFCLNGQGPVDLSAAKINAESQLLLIPAGLMGGMIKMVTQRMLGQSVHEIPERDWPQDIKHSGFNGSIIFMNELVLDIPSTLRALASPYKNSIRKMPEQNPFEFLKEQGITPKKIIFTAAQSNYDIAKSAGQDQGLQTQARPLLQGIMKNAPFPLYAHFVGNTDKPIVTITTHTAQDGKLVWYLGAGVAERAKESSPQDVYDAARKAFKNYMPDINLETVEWAVLPIDRIEGKSKTDHWMPDTPTIHRAENILYCWPTKLTFAPLLAEMIEIELKKDGISPSGNNSDFSFLPGVDYAVPPWDTAKWTK